MQTVFQPLLQARGLYKGTKRSTYYANSSTPFKLFSDGVTPSIIALDYRQDVEGYPTFQVSGKSGDTSAFEMNYSETQAVLDSYMVSKTNSDCVSIEYRLMSFREMALLPWPLQWIHTESTDTTSHPKTSATPTVWSKVPCGIRS